MQVIINIEKKHLSFLVLFVAIIGLTGYTIAYGGNEPTTMGHTFGEVDPATYSFNTTDSEGFIIERLQGVGVGPSLMYINDQSWAINHVGMDDGGMAEFSFEVKGNSFFNGPLKLAYGTITVSEPKLDLCHDSAEGNDLDPDCSDAVPTIYVNAIPLCMNGVNGEVGLCP